MIPSWLTFINSNLSELGVKIAEQLYLVATAVGIALVIGIPLGILAARRIHLRHWIIGFAGILQTIPGLALLVFLLPFFGVGTKPAIIALAIYAILPITTNTLTGITTISNASIEAADALGFTGWQRLWMVELPLALPTIIAGLRIATTIAMGTATLAAFIGAGGLGDFINRGLALNDTKFLLLGAISSAILALLLDFLIRRLELGLQKRRLRKSFLGRGLLILFFGIIVFVPVFVSYRHAETNVIRVGSGDFTEQIIVAEIMSQLIEQKTSLKVARSFNLGSAQILINAMRNNHIDLYATYTGTSYLNTLHQEYLGLDRQALYQFVKAEYLKKFQLVWLMPFGFNDTQAIAVRNQFAKQHQLQNLTDLSRISANLIIAAPADFINRPDGLPGLFKKYGIRFKAVKEFQPTLMYDAIRYKDVDVILGFSTDGRIPAYDLTVLTDDKNLFPPYDAAPVIRLSVLKAHPELENVLQLLANKIDDKTMQQLNYQVSVEKRDPVDVARDFLRKMGI